MNTFSLPLFKRKIEFFLFFAAVFLIFCLNIFSEYRKYEKFVSKRVYITDVLVLNQYKKRKKKEYFVLKLKAKEGFVFYTTTYEDLKNLKNRKLKVKIITKNVSFFKFLKGFYAPVFDMRLYPKERNLKNILIDLISSSHKEKMTKELFLALFLGVPISKELRQKVQFLGISHLIAISGFHLGVLFFIFYNILQYPYKFFQTRYFPYRNRILDLTYFTILILFLYLLICFTPSLLRAFVMFVFGFFLYTRAINILSFWSLFYSILLILALFPKFLFSIGFWFSVSGVFYIYLFLHHFKNMKNWQIFLFLNFFIFFAMMPIVHLFFGVFSYYQFLSPLLSMAFLIFYPVEIFLHLIGRGEILDFLIIKLFTLKGGVFYFKSSLTFVIFYIFLSILAVFRRFFFWVLLIFILFFIQNIAKF